MKIYTISPCLLEKAIASDVDALRLLLKFFTDSDIGLALDNKNRAINYYVTTQHPYRKLLVNKA